MWSLSALVACTEPGGSPEPPAAAGEVCEDAPLPPLSADAWSLAGPIPATGVLTLATDGAAPVWAGSHSTGVWLAGEDLAWNVLWVDITHTTAEIALRPGDPDHAFRSAGGHLTRTRDGGETWDGLALGDVAAGGFIDQVWAIAVTPWDPDRVLVVEKTGTATLSEDDGDTFVTQGYPPLHTLPPDDDPLHTYGWRILPEAAEGGRVLFTDGFGVAVSDDAMGTWRRTLDTPLGGYSLLRDPADPRHVVVGGPDGLYVSTDEGETWTLQDIGGDVLVGAWSTDGARLVLVGSDRVYASTDGASFTTHAHAYTHPAAVALLDDGRLLLAHHSGLVVSADLGATWADNSAGLEDRGVSVVVPHPTCAARVFAGSRCGSGLVRSADYGDAWESVPTYFHYVMGLYFDGTVAGRVWAVTDDRLLRSDDDGATWAELHQELHYHGFTLHPDDPDLLLLGSVGSGVWGDDAARVYRSEDGGTTWADSSTGIPASEASAHTLVRWPGAPDTVLLGTYKGGDVSHRTGVGIGLWRSTDGGGTWALADLPVDDISGLAAGDDAVVAATGEGIWRSEDEGVTWARCDGPETAVLAVTIRGAIGLALGEDGRVWKSEDAGVSWFQHDTDVARNPTTNLAQVGISADGAVGYVTVFDSGVWRIAL